MCNMKTISIFLGIFDKLNEDTIIIFDPKLYNMCKESPYLSKNIILNKEYKKTPIYVKKGPVFKCMNKKNSITADSLIRI